MRTAFFGLHVASSSLHTARAALNVTSHNIANAEIPGFSRQVAQMQAGRPLTVGSRRGMYGTGSQVTGIIQIRDQFLDRKFWNQSSLSGQFTAVNQHLRFVETVFNNVSEVGVKRTFNNFFSTVHDLTTRAHETTFRTNVVTTAHSLTEQVRQNAFALQRQQQDLNREFADVVHTINSLGTQIADINRQIHIFERDGSNANDLRDQRALLIDQLSNLVNIEVDERDFSRPGVSNDRRITILINGQNFINHTHKNSLELVPRNDPNIENSGPLRNEMDVSGLYDVFFAATGSRFNIHSPTLGGKLRGIVDVRDGNGGQPTVPPLQTGRIMLQTQLATLDRTIGFINRINNDLDILNANLPGFVTMRDNAFATINGTRAGALPDVTTTAQALAWSNELADMRTRRNDLNTSINSIRASITATTDVAGIRSAIGTTFLNSNPAINTAINNIQTVLNRLHNDNFDVDTFDDVAFRNDLSAALTALHTDLENNPNFVDQDFLSLLGGRIDGVANMVLPLTTAINDLEAHEAAIDAAVGDNLDTAIAVVIGAINQLNQAIRGISEITTYTQRIQTQLDWAVQNVAMMLYDVEQRMMEIEDGIRFGNVEDYEDLRDLIQAELDTLRGIAEGLESVASPGVYDTLPVLQDFITELRTDLDSNEGITRFAEILQSIIDEADDLPVGDSRPVTPTSNFKGIPFYMNQLNELVRTFARAINEGRNRDGSDIPTPIGRDANGTNIYATSTGHIFGYDANGENNNTLFFTFNDEMGNPAVLVNNDDPFRSLQRWILEDPDNPGNPWRYPNGNFRTVADPVPPANVARDGSGNAMFTIDYSQFNALNFIVNPELLGDPNLLAASSSQHIGEANNDIVHGFLAVGNDKSLFREGRLIDFIIATSSHLAVDTQQSGKFRISYHEITTQTQNQRLAVKSVDTEEEMLNLVRFQNMFTATSRLINVLDTVYDTLINRLGNF
ncbi:MAG: flagellar hook-associated protein FlgK [Defluviitaleaceae bacterium]|nr:flagellar hook-associated protein FlgK [Defluviitaleaceae bacterium]MCL2263988.1 flagellar hook-associated protein FlgK [Defluviitaleaceae bacterium]